MGKKCLDSILVLVLVSISILIQLYFLNPPILSDQLEYFQYASSFFQKPLPANHRALRLGLVIPTAVLIQVFDYSEFAYYALPVIGMAALIAGTFIFTLRMFSRRTAFFASLFMLVMPGLLLESGHLLPDVPSVGFSMLAIGLVASSDYGQKRNNSWWNFTLFLSGVLLGWSYLIREYMLLVLPVSFLVIWLKQIPHKKAVSLVIGLLAVLLVEFLYGSIFYGNPFIRFISAEPRPTAGNIERNVTKIFSLLFILLDRYKAESYIFLMVTAVLSPTLAVEEGKKSVFVLLIWLVSGYALLTTAALLPVIFNWTDRTLIRLHLFRYWLLILPPLVIAGLVGIEGLVFRIVNKISSKNKLREKAIVISLSVFWIFTAFQSFQYLTGFYKFIRYGSDQYLEFRDFLRGTSEEWDQIWLTSSGNRAGTADIPMYTKTSFGRDIWAGKIRHLNTPEGDFIDQEKIISGLVVINRYFLNPDRSDIPEYIASPPSNWKLVFLSENKELVAYSVDGN